VAVGHPGLGVNEWNIRIGFSASSGIGDLIRLVTGGDVNHAFILYFDPIFQTNLTLGAQSNGLTSEPLFEFPDQIIHLFEPLNSGFEEGLRVNTKWLDQPYDYAGLLGMSLVEAARAIGHWQILNPFLDKQKLFCSEYAAMVIRASGYNILPDYQAGTVDPYQLCQAMIARPDWFVHKLGVSVTRFLRRSAVAEARGVGSRFRAVESEFALASLLESALDSACSSPPRIPRLRRVRRRQRLRREGARQQHRQ
jgi:hypothetical protein